MILGWPAASRGLMLRQRVFFFSPEFCSRPYQNSGHTGGSFFFTRIWSPTIPKFRTFRRVFLFHQNFVPTIPKFWTYRRVSLFHQNLVTHHTKVQDIQEGPSFSSRILSQTFALCFKHYHFINLVTICSRYVLRYFLA